MNIIEQLGGYENVSKHFNRIEYHAETKIFIGEWFGFYSMRDLKDALLEYRRQHNIFEVGDKAVVKAHPFWPEDYVIHNVEQEHIGKWYMSAWRHATDEEIKAGKRL